MSALDIASLNVRKNVVFAVAAFGINIGLVFLSYRLVIKQSGLEMLGLWSTLYAWTNMIRLGDVGMANASLRFIALCDHDQDQRRLRAYLETGLISNTAFYIVLGVAGYALLNFKLVDLVEPRFLAEASLVLPVMMAGFVLMNISGILLGSLQGLHLGYLNSQLSVAGNLVQIVLVALLVPKIGLSGLAWAQVLQYGLSTVVAWLIVRRKLALASIIPLDFSKAAFVEMLGFSVKAQVANVANGLFEPLSKIMVGHFGGLHVLGLYELAFKTIALTRNLVASALGATLPALTTLMSRDLREANILYETLSRRNIRLTALLFVAVLTASPLISILWIGHFEAAYVVYALLLCLGFLVNAYGAPAYQLGMASGKMKNNMVTAGLGILILAILGAPAGLLFDGSGVVLIASATLAICGWLIKLLNEKLLLHPNAQAG
ncbi:oligosaccharide flippase family protein [Rhizobium sp. C1]|uniref:oligosaccharide flippase family protein n=1 Tax=Rhizobium sp. C1 TaxID=1349799 RepID=UPI001E65752F|nr:oligosaccharide flippase family protein [Rhizobium sp. C1]MCD2178048.1 oligosaccharide flippase family protein [Rhizobium sp. C1]